MQKIPDKCQAMDIIKNYFDELYFLSAEMAPYLLLGFIFAGLLHVYIKREAIVKYLGGKSIKSAIYAALIGIPLPLCSCGVIPTGIALRREGASKPATISFLISTPQTGIDSILVTWSLLGWPLAVIRPIVALLTGAMGGAVSLLKKEKSDNISHEPAEKKVSHSTPGWIRMLKYAFIDFMDDIAKWLLIGLLLAALMAVIIPDGFFTMYVDNNLLSMLIVLAASVPLYLCATGSVPVAAVLMMKGLSPGAALVFLMAGPATNIATMTVIGKALGKWALLVYLSTIILGSLIFGLLTDMILSSGYMFGIMDHVHHDHSHELLPEWIKIASLVILGIFLFYSLLKRYLPTLKVKVPTGVSHPEKGIYRFEVTGMTCNHCKTTVEDALNNLPGIKDVSSDIRTGIVTIQSDNPDPVSIEEKLKPLGYGFREIEKSQGSGIG